MSTNKQVTNFVQFSREYMKNWRILIRKNSVAAEILMYLTEKMGHNSNAVVCSYRTLGEVTCLSRTSVAKAIKVLKSENWIQAVKVGNATAYVVNERVAWRASQHSRKHAIFSAVVVASESEQVEDWTGEPELRNIPFIEDGERPMIGREKLPPPDQQDLDLE